MAERVSHLIFLENEKGGQLLKNPHQYKKGWESPIDLESMNQLIADANESVRAEPSDNAQRPHGSSENTEPVRDSTEDPEFQIQGNNPGGNFKDIDPIESLSPENQGGRSSDSDEVSDTIIVALRPQFQNPMTAEPIRSWCDQEIRPSAWYEDASMTQKLIKEPATYKEVMVSSTYSCQWAQAVDEELTSLISNGTWEIVDLSNGRQPVTSKWVFKVKYTSNDLVDHFKAHLVARGFSQQYEIDYEEIFVSTLHFESLRLLFSIAAIDDLHIHQMNVVSAYLAGHLEEEIYMKISESLSLNTLRALPRHVCRLIKDLYELKQSGWVWNNTFRATLMSMEFKKFSDNNSVFLNRKSGVVIALYVDNLLLFGRDLGAIKDVKQRLQTVYKMKDLGEAKICLRIWIQQDWKNWTLTINQQIYIEKILKNFFMTDFKPVSTSIDSYESINSLYKDGESMANQLEYQQAVESLMYIITAICPDLAFTVDKFSQFCHNPTACHWAGLQWVFQYLKSTKTQKISYSAASPKGIFGYADLNYAGDILDWCFMHGNVFLHTDGAVTWFSQKQKTTSMSMTEAEYVALCSTCKTAAWISEWLKGVNFTQFLTEKPVQLYSDNQGSIWLGRNSEFHARIKHIAVQYHYVWEALEDSLIELSYVSISSMAADCLTKPLMRDKFDVRVFLLSLVNF